MINIGKKEVINIEKEDFEYFLNKYIGIVYQDTNKLSFTVGKLVKVTDSSITIIINGLVQVFSINYILRVRGIKNYREQDKNIGDSDV